MRWHKQLYEWLVESCFVLFSTCPVVMDLFPPIAPVLLVCSAWRHCCMVTMAMVVIYNNMKKRKWNMTILWMQGLTFFTVTAINPDCSFWKKEWLQFVLILSFSCWHIIISFSFNRRIYLGNGTLRPRQSSCFNHLTLLVRTTKTPAPPLTGSSSLAILGKKKKSLEDDWLLKMSYHSVVTLACLPCIF